MLLQTMVDELSVTPSVGGGTLSERQVVVIQCIHLLLSSFHLHHYWTAKLEHMVMLSCMYIYISLQMFDDSLVSVC